MIVKEKVKPVATVEQGQNIVRVIPEGGVEVITDRDRLLFYERKRWLYSLSLPLMWVLVSLAFFKKKILHLTLRTNTLWFDGLSLPCRQVKEGAGSWRALDLIYNFQFGQRDGLRCRIGDFWFGMINAQAVRNRLKLVKRELAKAIRDISQKEDRIQILSIASGSAQGIIETMSALKDIDIKATVIDLDPTAIAYSRTMARKHGVENRCTFIVGNTHNLKNVTNGVRPHIIEMVGFLDYRPHPQAVRLIKEIHRTLLPGGRLLTANICPNQEQSFLKWIVNWTMIYRKPKELGNILIEGGFAPENCQIVLEPLQVHMVAICHKP